jgi:hypothetical protein
MMSFNVTVVQVCAIIESTHLVDGLVWVGSVCQVVFGKLRRPFGSGQGVGQSAVYEHT